jgi:hypothetical protein
MDLCQYRWLDALKSLFLLTEVSSSSQSQYYSCICTLAREREHATGVRQRAYTKDSQSVLSSRLGVPRSSSGRCGVSQLNSYNI